MGLRPIGHVLVRNFGKGETSGHYQHVKEILVDCDCDTILLKVVQDGAACHTGKYSCFYRTLEGEEIL